MRLWPADERRPGVPWSALAMLPGVLALGAGALLDVAYHLGVGESIGLVASLAGDDGESAHLLLFVGMALVVAGLLVIGVGSGRARRASLAIVKPVPSPAGRRRSRSRIP